MLHIPTTDQMDQTTPEERYALAAMCIGCAAWKKFTGSKYDVVDGETVMRQSQTDGLTCDTCGGDQFRDIISQRTFDEARAKKQSVAWMRKKKR